MPHRDEEGGWRRPRADEAEGTHYQPFTRETIDFAGREQAATDRTYLSGAHSIRMHSQATSWGLAAKIAAPVPACLLVGLTALVLLVQARASSLQLAAAEAGARTAAEAIGAFGRALLARRDGFMAEHPDYGAASEWRVGGHWLAAGGFVDGERWAAAVGSPLDAMAPIGRLERARGSARLLAPSGEGPDGSAGHGLAAAYVLDLSGSPVASSLDLAADLPGGDPELWTLPGTEEGTEEDAGAVRIDYPADRTRTTFMRVAAPIFADAAGRERVGTAVALFRVDGLDSGRRGGLALAAPVAAGILALTTVACWLSAGRVTKPLRRLTADLHAVADGDLSRRSTVPGSDELALLAQAFNSMAERMRVARMDAMAANRLDSDLAVAKGIQNTLLPSPTPRIRGLDIFSSCRPARELGGDYYDFLPVDGRRLGVVIADASGKSIPAALVMATTRAILRFVAPGSVSAAETLSRANAILSVDIPRGMFVTAYYVILEPLMKGMVCASAGHNPLLIGRADGSVESVAPGGIALGFDQGPIFQSSIKEQRIQLAAGDRVLLYTDGVVECANAENEEYSDRRLQEFLRRHRDLSSTDFVGELLADLDRHRGPADIRDDTTVVTFKVL